MEGVRIVLTDRNRLDSPLLGVELMAALWRLYGDRLQIDRTLSMIGSRGLARGHQGAGRSARRRAILDARRGRVPHEAAAAPIVAIDASAVDIVDGLDKALQVLIGLFESRYRGKMAVRV